MIELKVLSSLEKVIADYELTANEIITFSMLKNEKLNFQIAIKSDETVSAAINLNSEISSLIKMYEVKDVPVGTAAYENADDYVISKKSGMYPDVLVQFDCEIVLEANKWKSIWIEICGDDITHGEFDICLNICNLSVNVKVKIINKSLPEQKLVYTNWYHSDCLIDYYKIKPLSDEYWRINFNFIKTAAEHGINCILTPLFTPPLDTAVNGERTTIQLVKVTQRGSKYLFDFRNLKKWVDMCKKAGIKYFEMSHFFTQWGAKHCPKIIVYDKKGRAKKKFGWFTRTSSKEYTDFLTQLGAKLDEFIKKENLQNNVFFHISDEPGLEHLNVYKKRAEVITRIFGKYKIIDALSEYEFYKNGSIDIPIPCENNIEDFAGKVDELWTYYCCCQCYETEPNRFITMPSLRNRIIGLLLYKYDVTGFLQWGYNFYNLQYSTAHINPYEITDAGGGFPSGDSFVVYPADDGSAYPSLRLKVFYDALQDIRALKLCEDYIGKDEVIKMIGDIKFNNYPHNNDYLLNLRNEVNNIISTH